MSVKPVTKQDCKKCLKTQKYWQSRRDQSFIPSCRDTRTSTMLFSYTEHLSMDGQLPTFISTVITKEQQSQSLRAAITESLGVSLKRHGTSQKPLNLMKMLFCSQLTTARSMLLKLLLMQYIAELISAVYLEGNRKLSNKQSIKTVKWWVGNGSSNKLKISRKLNLKTSSNYQLNLMPIGAAIPTMTICPITILTVIKKLLDRIVSHAQR